MFFILFLPVSLVLPFFKWFQFTSRGFLNSFINKTVSFACLFLLFTNSVFSDSCREAVESSGEESKIPKTVSQLGEAVTKGLKLTKKQEELWNIYQQTFFESPNNMRSGIEKVFQILEWYPDISKPIFREQILSFQSQVYKASLDLLNFVKKFREANLRQRMPLIRPESELPYWLKALMPSQKKLSKEEIKKYKPEIQEKLKKIFGREVSENLRHNKGLEEREILRIYRNLQKEREEQLSQGQDNPFLSKAMLSLIHTAGLSKPLWMKELKDKDPIIILRALKKVLEYREHLALTLGFESFGELKASLGLINLDKNSYDIEILLERISNLESEVKALGFREEFVKEFRVRALSLEESPFRGCMGGSDCSSNIYFDKGLDPNFIYWTKTNERFQSSGQMTTVLGEAERMNGQKLKVAFVDKIQNLSKEELIPFLLAVRESLKEVEYILALPIDVGNSSRALSNALEISSFIENSILPELRDHNILKNFQPHANRYYFSKGYSRAYKGLDLKEFDWKGSGAWDIRPGSLYEPYRIETLNTETLISQIFSLKDSKKTEDLITFINNILALNKMNFPEMSHQKLKISLRELLDKDDLDLKVRKKALYGLMELKGKFDFPEFVEVFYDFFEPKERQMIIGEMSNWKTTKDQTKQNFFRALEIAFYFDLVPKEDFSKLFTSKEDFLQQLKEMTHKDDIFFEMRADYIYFSSKQGYLSFVKAFFENSPGLLHNLRLKSFHDHTELHATLFGGNKNVAEFLIDLGADINGKAFNLNGEFEEADNITPLHYAVMSGDKETVEFVIKNGADIHAKDSHGKTPLDYFAEWGESLDILEILLNKLSEEDLKLKDYKQAFDLATMYQGENFLEFMIEFLIRKGINSQEKRELLISSLSIAIELNNKNIVAFLVKMGVDMKSPKIRDSFFMHDFDQTEILEFLIKNGLDIHEKNKVGKNMLHITIEKGTGNEVEVLFKNGADIKAKDKNGKTPMDYALKSGDKEIIVLVEKYL